MTEAQAHFEMFLLIAGGSTRSPGLRRSTADVEIG